MSAGMQRGSRALRALRMPRMLRAGAAAVAVAAVLAGALGLAPHGAVRAAAADGEVTWSVQPSSPTGPDGRTHFDLSVPAGTIVNDWVSVINFSDIPADFLVYAADGGNDYHSGGFAFSTSDDQATGLGAWTRFSGETALAVRLEPGTRRDIPFTISVPSDATPGDHAAGIVAAVVQPDRAGNVTLEQRVVNRVLLRVQGDLAPRAGITGFTAGYGAPLNPFAGGDVTAGYDVVNQGNVRVGVNHRLEVAGPFGIGRFVLGEGSIETLLPGQAVRVGGEAAGVPPLLMLFATATATLVPLDPDTVVADDIATVEATAMAWAVPWVLVLLLVLLAGGAVALVWWLRRRRRALAAEIARALDAARAEGAVGEAGPAASEPQSETRSTGVSA